MALVPVVEVLRSKCWAVDDEYIFSIVLIGRNGVVVGAGFDDGFICDYNFVVLNADGLIYPNRYTGVEYLLNAGVCVLWVKQTAVYNHLNFHTAIFCFNQCLGYLSGGEAVALNV